MTAQLIETSTNTHVWADRYDRVLEDIFDVQDEIVQSIVGTIVPRFVASYKGSAFSSVRTSVIGRLLFPSGCENRTLAPRCRWREPSTAS